MDSKTYLEYIKNTWTKATKYSDVQYDLKKFVDRTYIPIKGTYSIEIKPADLDFGFKKKINTKRCSKCKAWKERGEFYKCKNKKDGLIPWCKKCRLKYKNRPENKAKEKLRRNTPENKAKANLRRNTPENKAKAKLRRNTPENKARKKEYNNRPEYKAKEKLRKSTPENKAKDKLRKSTPEYKTKEKLRKSTPEYKTKEKLRKSTPEYKVKEKENHKEYRNRPENKVKRRKYDKEYHSKQEFKSRRKEYDNSPETKAKRKEYYSRPDVIAWRKEYENSPETKARRRKYKNRPENKARGNEYSKKYHSRPEVIRRAYELRVLHIQKRLGKYHDDMTLHEYSIQKSIWSKTIKSKNNGRCIDCNAPANQAHHVLYVSTHPKLEFDLDNGVPLCILCHAEKHKFDKHCPSALIKSRLKETV